MRFVKYQALGNDFVLLDYLDGGAQLTPQQAVALCDRRRGIGADGVLTVWPAATGCARMQIHNSDGSVAEMCGNGLRCVAVYLANERGMKDEKLTVETGNGPLECAIIRDQAGKAYEVRVDMGRPELEASRIPMAAQGRFVRQPISLPGRELRGTAVSMGNPHLVLFDLPVEQSDLLGPQLERHPLFPARTNVEFARVVDRGLVVKVWERGCAFTEACGTGACASMVAAVLENRLPAGEERPVQLPGGVLHIQVLPDLSKVFMRGPAVRVFAGEVDSSLLG